MPASLLLSVLLAGCGGVAAVPVEGSWSVTPGTVADDDCDQVDDGDDGIWPEGYTLTSQDGGFELFETLSEIAVDCELSRGSFECGASESSDSGSQGSDNYTVTESTVLTGDVGSETEMDVVASTTITCESGGSLCADIESTLGLSFPCSVVLEYGITAN
jgi:hypothetical protein